LAGVMISNRKVFSSCWNYLY